MSQITLGDFMGHTKAPKNKKAKTGPALAGVIISPSPCASDASGSGRAFSGWDIIPSDEEVVILQNEPVNNASDPVLAEGSKS